MENLATDQYYVHFITYARCVDLNVCTYCDFLLPVSIILAANHECFWFMLMLVALRVETCAHVYTHTHTTTPFPDKTAGSVYTISEKTFILIKIHNVVAKYICWYYYHLATSPFSWKVSFDKLLKCNKLC